MFKYTILLISIFFLSFSCSMMVLDSAALTTEINGVRVYVEADQYDLLTPSLEQYKSDLEAEGYSVELISWSGAAEELRTDLQDWTDGTWSAFFVGDLPYVSYKMTEDGSTETFPTDVYFSSPFTTWGDSDLDGNFDSHSEPLVTIPVSRIKGTTDEIEEYLSKVHQYRIGSLTFSGEGSIFKDDDWSDYKKGYTFGMNNFLSEINMVETLDDTYHPNYSDVVDRGDKYLYQWIHANPSALYVQEDNSYNKFRYTDINSDSVNVGFINMFDCEAARFTQTNLGMTYLINTDSTLAVMGSTKKGGNFDSLEFHRSLASDSSWSEGYRQWYNAVGVHDDMWYLGIVILGDPLLQPHMERAKSTMLDLQQLLPPTEDEMESNFSLLRDFEIPQ